MLYAGFRTVRSKFGGVAMLGLAISFPIVYLIDSLSSRPIDFSKHNRYFHGQSGEIMDSNYLVAK